MLLLLLFRGVCLGTTAIHFWRLGGIFLQFFSPSDCLAFIPLCRSSIYPCKAHPRQCWEKWWQIVFFLPRKIHRFSTEPSCLLPHWTYLLGECRKKPRLDDVESFPYKKIIIILNISVFPHPSFSKGKNLLCSHCYYASYHTLVHCSIARISVQSHTVISLTPKVFPCGNFFFFKKSQIFQFKGKPKYNLLIPAWLGCSCKL